VKIAREFCEDVEFSPEDASRTELDFLAQVVSAAIAAGATTINIPDTVGYTVPDEYCELFRYLTQARRGIERARLRCTATTTSAWRSPTASAAVAAARARSSAR
jgi:2-isopropylmalate synthase